MMSISVDKPFPVILARHASIPSHEVPDIKPITFRLSFSLKRIKFSIDILHCLIKSYSPFLKGGKRGIENQQLSFIFSSASDFLKYRGTSALISQRSPCSYLSNPSLATLTASAMPGFSSSSIVIFF